MNEIGYVYILTNRPRGVLYIGVTSDLKSRISEHRQGLTPGFASKYHCKTLVWYEQHDGIESAIQREKSLKRYNREWKINLVEEFNPSWNDLFDRCYEVQNLFVPSFVKRYAECIEDPRDGARG